MSRRRFSPVVAPSPARNSIPDRRSSSQSPSPAAQQLLWESSQVRAKIFSDMTQAKGTRSYVKNAGTRHDVGESAKLLATVAPGRTLRRPAMGEVAHVDKPRKSDSHVLEIESGEDEEGDTQVEPTKSKSVEHDAEQGEGSGIEEASTPAKNTRSRTVKNGTKQENLGRGTKAKKATSKAKQLPPVTRKRTERATPNTPKSDKRTTPSHRRTSMPWTSEEQDLLLKSWNKSWGELKALLPGRSRGAMNGEHHKLVHSGSTSAPSVPTADHKGRPRKEDQEATAPPQVESVDRKRTNIRHAPWTEEEDTILLKNYGKPRTELLPLLPNRSLSGIIYRHSVLSRKAIARSKGRKRMSTALPDARSPSKRQKQSAQSNPPAVEEQPAVIRRKIIRPREVPQHPERDEPVPQDDAVQQQKLAGKTTRRPATKVHAAHQDQAPEPVEDADEVNGTDGEPAPIEEDEPMFVADAEAASAESDRLSPSKADGESQQDESESPSDAASIISAMPSLRRHHCHGQNEALMAILKATQDHQEKEEDRFRKREEQAHFELKAVKAVRLQTNKLQQRYNELRKSNNSAASQAAINQALNELTPLLMGLEPDSVDKLKFKTRLALQVYLFVFPDLIAVLIHAVTCDVNMEYQDEYDESWRLNNWIAIAHLILKLYDRSRSWKTKVNRDELKVQPIRNKMLVPLRPILAAWNKEARILEAREREARRVQAREKTNTSKLNSSTTRPQEDIEAIQCYEEGLEAERQAEMELYNLEKRLSTIHRYRAAFAQPREIRRFNMSPDIAPKWRARRADFATTQGVEEEIDADGRPFERVVIIGERRRPPAPAYSAEEEEEEEWSKVEMMAVILAVEEFSGSNLWYNLFRKYCRTGGILDQRSAASIMRKAGSFRSTELSCLGEEEAVPEWIESVPDLDLIELL